MTDTLRVDAPPQARHRRARAARRRPDVVGAHHHGATGAQRAERQLVRLGEAGLAATVRPGPEDGATLRLGPLAHEAAWLAIEAFLGRPLDVPA
jgi:hypothetical protein